MAGVETSCGIRTEAGKADDVLVLETVARIGSKLLVEASEAVVESSLRELQGVRMTFQALQATKIGRAVNALRKTVPSEQARRLAAALYTGWKALADERFSSSSAPPPPPKADKQGIEKRSSSSLPPPPLDAKQTARPEGNREMAPANVVVVEAAPETKLHLHEGIDSAATVKKPTCLRLRVVEQPQRRVTVVRRTTAATSEPAPASASNTAGRNGGGSKTTEQANCPATARRHQGTNTAAKRVSVSPTAGGASPSTTATNKPPPTAPIAAGSSGACRKRKAEPPTVFDEARLAMATPRLRERYKEADAAKKNRKTKEIDAIDALRRVKARQQQRPAQLVRCTAAHRTRTGMVPCRPVKMSRAF